MNEEIRAYLEEHNPEAILWDNCDSALLGTARIKRDDVWTIVAMYSYELLILHFMGEFNNSEETVSERQLEEEAMEWVDYNIVGAYVGPHTPMIVYS
jgi:hypothetical protein